MGELKLALVIASGSSSISGMMNILKEMNIPVKVLADLDFAFSAYKFHLIEKENQYIQKCLDILSEIQPEHGFNLQGRYPSSGNGFKAAQIYELLAQQSKAKDSIQGLIEHFKTHSIWVWKSGAIEPHLCLEAKETGEWYKFKQDLNEKEIEEVIGDSIYIQEFANWCIHRI